MNELTFVIEVRHLSILKASRPICLHPHRASTKRALKVLNKAIEILPILLY